MDLKIEGHDDFKAMSQPHEDGHDEFKENSASHRLNAFIWMKMNSTSSRMNSASRLQKVPMFC